MEAFLRTFHGVVLSAGGIVLLGAVDSSIVFFVPLATDLSVVALAAAHRDLFWLYPLCATAGSLLGAAGSFWIGRTLGRQELGRFLAKPRLKRLERRTGHTGALALGAPALVPAPLPFTPLIVASGAIGVPAGTFFAGLAGARFLRFGAEAALAVLFGDSVLAWLRSDAFRVVVVALAALAVLGTGYTVVRLWRSAR